MQQIGEQVADVVVCAQSELVIVAPFIKAEAIRSLLGDLRDKGPRLLVITRWRPEEILAGASDLEVFDLVEAGFGGELRLCPALHAKYYRGDKKALVGSANVTFKAFGVGPAPNLEILVPVDPDDSDIKLFEAIVLAQSFRATQQIRDGIAKQVAELRAAIPTAAIEALSKDEATGDGGSWLPLCMRPELLYKIYSGARVGTFLDSTVAAAQSDLAALRVMPGMTEEAFQRYVAQTLRHLPLVRKIDELLKLGNLADDPAALLIDEFHFRMVEGYDSAVHWTILKAWLTHFFPSTYRTRASSEVLELSRVIYGNGQ